MLKRLALILLLGSVYTGSLARGTYQEPDAFLAEAFSDNAPEPAVIWLTGERKDVVKQLLGHRYSSLRVRYWRRAQRSAWILEAIGKDLPITILLGRWAEGPCYTIDVSGKIACYGKGGYLEVTDISNPLNPVELSKVVLPSFVSDVKISGNYVYVADEWGGFRVVDISVPANAVEAGFLSLVGSSNRLSVAGNYAYITSEHYGLYILDIADPANPVVTGSIKLVDVFGFIYDVTANTNYVYVYLAGKGIDIIEVSEPSGPNEAGFLEGSGYYGNFDLALDGNYLFCAGAPDGLQIVDVSDPKIPVVVADITGDFDKVSVKDNYLYAGSGRFIYVFNISDKSNPIQVGSFKAGGNKGY